MRGWIEPSYPDLNIQSPEPPTPESDIAWRLVTVGGMLNLLQDSVSHHCEVEGFEDMTGAAARGGLALTAPSMTGDKSPAPKRSKKC